MIIDFDKGNVDQVGCEVRSYGRDTPPQPSPPKLRGAMWRYPRAVPAAVKMLHLGPDHLLIGLIHSNTATLLSEIREVYS